VADVRELPRSVFERLADRGLDAREDGSINCSSFARVSFFSR